MTTSPLRIAPKPRMTTQYGRSKVGFPIRKSLDQSSFAAPQGLSQRTTSFIASQRQGIHQMLLRHLIALMIGVRREPQPDRLSLTPSTVTIKTGSRLFRTRCLMLAERTPAGRFRNGQGTFPLHDVRYPQPPAICVDGAKLFDPDDPATSAAFGRGGWWSWTGSNRRPHACKARALPTELQPRGAPLGGRGHHLILVGLGRLERPTSPLSGVRSNHLSYRPVASIPPACPDDEKEKRRRRVPPNGL